MRLGLVVSKRINGALVAKQAEVDVLKRREKSLSDLADAVKDVAGRRLPAIHDELKREYAGAGLTPTEWQDFGLRFTGDPAQIAEATPCGSAPVRRRAGRSWPA